MEKLKLSTFPGEFIASYSWNECGRKNRELFERVLSEEFIADTHEVELFFRKYPAEKIDPVKFYQVNLDNQIQKNDWIIFKSIIEKNGIKSLYHFTDSRNIESIKSANGLYSQNECENRNLKVVYASDPLSRQIDGSKNMDDYIRLSFVNKHPMLFSCMKQNRIIIPRILEINMDVLFWKVTILSDKNSTCNSSKIGGDLLSLLEIKFDIINTYTQYYRVPEEEKPYYQAEILVKKHIPIEFIKSI